MPSISRIHASDEGGNASVATVTLLRAANATTQHVDTVNHIPSTANGFYATMGTPHSFTDPVSGETITEISEATAVDFQGHINTGNIIIDAIAPGYTDAGSKVGDIVIIRPTTQWADNLADTLAVVHNDDGSFKADSITSEAPFVDAVDPVKRYSEIMFDHVASGCVWSGDAYASTKAASMTSGVVYIGGKRVAVSSVTARTFTASKDTYVDVDNTGTITYTEVANNAASPALAANSIRLAIIVTGASNIAAASSINQGQEDRVLPIASSVPYAVTDSLGNLICPRDPNRRLLGYRQITTTFQTTNSSATQVTGLTCPVIVPAGRKVKVSMRSANNMNGTATAYSQVTIWEGVVGSGSLLATGRDWSATTLRGPSTHIAAIRTPGATSVTYNAGLHAEGGGQATLLSDTGSSWGPTYIEVALA